MLLVSDVLTQARELLQDKAAPYRFPQESLIFSVNEAMYEARRLRPDLFTGQLRTSLTRVAATTDPIPLDEQYMPALVNYVVGRAEMREDEFATDRRAALMHSAFITALVRGA